MVVDKSMDPKVVAFMQENDVQPGQYVVTNPDGSMEVRDYSPLAAFVGRLIQLHSDVPMEVIPSIIDGWATDPGYYTSGQFLEEFRGINVPKEQKH